MDTTSYWNDSASLPRFGKVEADSLVIVLVWVYYSAQILFFSAQFTSVYASRFGVKPPPVRGAEFAPIEMKPRPAAAHRVRSHP